MKQQQATATRAASEALYGSTVSSSKTPSSSAHSGSESSAGSDSSSEAGNTDTGVSLEPRELNNPNTT